MKNAIAIALLSALFLFPAAGAVAADAPPAVKAAVRGTKSMAEKGSYHRLHAEKEKLDCEDCHETGLLPPGTLNLRYYEPLAKDSPGPVTAETCHECHGKKQKKGVTWYAPQKAKR
jgi:cytochrome c553